jgi:hypothetical protein
MKPATFLKLLVLTLGFSSCADRPTPSHGNEAVFRQLSLALQPPPGKEHCGHYSLDLAKIAPFAWDSVYLVAGDTENETGYANYKLGSLAWRGPQIHDGYKRLFFVAQ